MPADTMRLKEHLTFLYHSLAKAYNALNMMKFSATTFEQDRSLKSFLVIYVDSYYSLYANLSALFDNTKTTKNLSRCINSKDYGEQERQHNIRLFNELSKKHEVAISQLENVRNNATAHLSSSVNELDLYQNSMDLQLLILDLFEFFKKLKGFDIDLSEPLILDDFPQIRDELGQRELWNAVDLARLMGLRK
jgi:hypothetical protein